jgi:hypothetical protein
MSPGIAAHVPPDWSLGWNLRTNGMIVLDRFGFALGRFDFESFWFWIALGLLLGHFGFESFWFWIVLGIFYHVGFGSFGGTAD